MTSQHRAGFSAIFGLPGFNAPQPSQSQTGGAPKRPMQVVSPVAAEDQRMHIRANANRQVRAKKRKTTPRKKKSKLAKTGRSE
jgi:hypothetical protein